MSKDVATSFNHIKYDKRHTRKRRETTRVVPVEMLHPQAFLHLHNIILPLLNLRQIDSLPRPQQLKLSVQI